MRKNEEDQTAMLVRCGTGVVLGGAAALLVSLAVLLLASVAISRGALGEGLLYQVTVAGCVLGSFAGGLLAVRRCGADCGLMYRRSALFAAADGGRSAV